MKKRCEATKTYCNPLSMPHIPRGKDAWYKQEHGMFSHENKPSFVDTPDYRSISDPTVFYHDNKWYLYPSYGMAWVSEDFENWQFVKTEPYCPKYSPCIIPWKGKFLLTAWFCPLYEADTPLGPFRLLGDFIDRDGKEFTPCDPCIFADDDGRIYMYAVVDDILESQRCTIIGYELDRDNPRQVVQGPTVIVDMNPKTKPWERHGLHNQNTRYGWVEGPHLLKYNGRYYMIYASPDTCDASYCMAVYYSDDSPLNGFVCQKNNPLTFHRGGIITGAGHGCVEKGPDDTLWAFYTIACPYLHCYERRIGMDRIEVNADGELYCKGVTDTPQPTVLRKEPLKEYFSLTGYVRPVVSSHSEGRDGVYATDESNLTFWLPKKEDKQPTLECDLTGRFLVVASRLFWRELGLDYAKGILPAPVQYYIEGYDEGEWFMLLDMRQNAEEKNIDYRVFEERECSKVRLTITGCGAGLQIGVIDFAVFGRMKEENE